MRALILFAATVIACLHWFGIVVGGAAIGLSARNMREAIFLGVIFGTGIWLLFVVYMGVNGLAGKYLAMIPISYLGLVLTVATSTLAASLRSLFDFKN
jgi:hypothetical protein